jgi:hypothetical protein
MAGLPEAAWGEKDKKKDKEEEYKSYLDSSINIR